MYRATVVVYAATFTALLISVTLGTEASTRFIVVVLLIEVALYGLALACNYRGLADYVGERAGRPFAPFMEVTYDVRLIRAIGTIFVLAAIVGIAAAVLEPSKFQ